MKNALKLVTILVAFSATAVAAADWPWIYGPRRDHTSDQKGLLRTWPQEGPKVLWTVPTGAGFGGPAVSGGNVYLLDRDEKVGDTLRVLDLASGEELNSPPNCSDYPLRACMSASATATCRRLHNKVARASPPRSGMPCMLRVAT